MKYYGLKSIIEANKEHCKVTNPQPYFNISETRSDGYFEPTFTKIDFDNEKPSVILISAVGATGKSALANTLSADIKMPTLNLTDYRPVAANSLTGLLVEVYGAENIGDIISKILDSKTCIIIDGIDEGLSKTTTSAFESFLDDIAKYCKANTGTSFVLLGRGLGIETCWAYLEDKQVTTGFISIDPFDIDTARNYIDYQAKFDRNFASGYREARDAILNCIEETFTQSSQGDDYIEFLGYPPVLDSIALLLKDTKNYRSIVENFSYQKNPGVEVKTIIQIVESLLDREKNEKIKPNILDVLLSGVADEYKATILNKAFGSEEQCFRIMKHVLREPCNEFKTIDNEGLNIKYEEQISSFLPGHPFLNNFEFRNMIFEAATIATLLSSSNNEYVKTACEYSKTHKLNHYTVFILNQISQKISLNLDAFPVVYGSALEFYSRNTNVNVDIDEDGASILFYAEVRKENDVKNLELDFIFKIQSDQQVVVWDKIYSTTIITALDFKVDCNTDIELIPPLDISCNKLSLNSTGIKVSPSKQQDTSCCISCNEIWSKVEKIHCYGNKISIITDTKNVGYPLINHTIVRSEFNDQSLDQKYKRLRRIFLEFKSHSKGSLAKYKDKIEHARVLREDGRHILNRLISDGILYSNGVMFHVDPERFSLQLGVSWQDFRLWKMSAKLKDYISSL